MDFSHHGQYKDSAPAALGAEGRVGDPVPDVIQDTWVRWRLELSSLSTKDIPRCYFPKTASMVSVQLHGFSDASEKAYCGVIYMRMIDSLGNVHVSLVMSKTRVAPIKRLSIPRLELCGAEFLLNCFSMPRSCLTYQCPTPLLGLIVP